MFNNVFDKMRLFVELHAIYISFLRDTDLSRYRSQ
jgi:hypothetical protein